MYFKSFGAAAIASVALLSGQSPEGSAPRSHSTNDPAAQGLSPSQIAWQQLKRQHPGWAADWTPATRTPNGIITDGLQVAQAPIATIEQARPYAQAILERHADVLGRGQSTFVEDIAQKVNQLHVFVYDQHYRGLEVIGGRADVRIHEIGRVPMFGAVAVQIPDGFSVTPAIGSDEATARAYRAAGVGVPQSGPLQAPPATRLVIWADVHLPQVTPVRLAWEVRIGTRDDGKYGRSYVDAHNGQILRYETDLHECAFGCNHGAPERAVAAKTTTGSGLRVEVEHDFARATPGRVNVTGNIKGWLVPGLDNRDPTVVRTLENLRGVRVTIPSTAAFAFTDDNGDFDIAHAGTTPVGLQISFASARRMTNVVSASGVANFTATPTVTPGVPANIVIYTNTANQYERAQTTCFWFVDGVNEYARRFIGALPAATDQINCRVNVVASCNATYGGNQINFYAASASCANTAYTTVVQHEWGHGIDDRYGGISQIDGLSEGWGDIWGTYHSGQPILGPNFYNTGAFVRTALNTRTYPAGGGVHQQGETWMGFAWDLRINLIATLGAVHGVTHAEKIVLPAIVANPTNQPTAVREVYLLDDNDGNLANGTPYCVQLEAARTKRTLPAIAGLTCTPGTWMYSPVAYQAAEGESNNTFPFGSSATHSYQQVHGDMRGRSKTITGISFRRDGELADNTLYAAKTITADLFFGPGNHLTFGNTYLTNYSGARTQVATGVFNMPGYETRPLVPPAEFTFRIPVTAYAWNGAADLIWECRTSAMSSAHAMFSDAASAPDTGTSSDVSYGSGCTSTGQANPFALNSAFTTSQVNNRHTFAWNGRYARASQPSVVHVGTAATNLPIGGLCTNIYTLPVFALSTTSNAAGDVSVGPISSPFDVSWIGATLYAQAACVDLGQAGFYKVSASDGSRCAVPALGGPRVTRLFNTSSASAATGTIGRSYGLVVAFD
jgi:hypothetical protein